MSCVLLKLFKFTESLHSFQLRHCSSVEHFCGLEGNLEPILPFTIEDFENINVIIIVKKAVQIQNN